MQLFGMSGADVGGGTDWGGLINAGLGTWGQISMAKQQNKMLKRLTRLSGGGGIGFAPAVAAGVPAATGGGGLGALLGGLGAGIGGLLGLGPDLLPGGLEEGGTGIFGPDLFRPTNAGARQRMLDAVHPTTGERVYWRPVGKPVMFAGDRALLLRTRKVVRKLSSSAGCGAPARRSRRRR